MKSLIHIKKGRDSNGNQTLSATLQDYAGTRRQRDKAIPLDQDLKAIAIELLIKNGLFADGDIDNCCVYTLNDKQFAAIIK